MRERRTDGRRQAVREPRRPHARRVGGRHEEITAPRAPREEITDRLHGRKIIPAARRERARLIVALERDAREHAGTEILRRHLHEQRGVRDTGVAAVVAHAVRHEPTRLRGRRDDLSARTHAERVRAAPRLAILIRQRVVRDRQSRLAGIRTVLRPVDEVLRMLDAHAHGERLRLHREPARIEHLIRIARRMADAEKCCIRLDALLSRDDERGEPSARELHIRDLRAEAHLAAKAADLLTQVLYDRAQKIRTDMRLVQVEDLLRRARRNECLEHIAHVRIADARRELAVGERPRATLAELHIRGGRKGAAVPERQNIAMTRIDILTALQDERRLSRARERECREHPRGTKSHDNGTPFSLPERPL